jgi:ABC-type glycerol-3-phosphate transport system substrate-binding protein
LKLRLSSFYRLLSGLLLLGLLLTACQVTPPGIEPAPTQGAKSATPQPATTRTPTVLPSLTPTFPADVQRLNGLKLVLWHPYMGDLEKALMVEVDEFNHKNAWGLQIELLGFGGAQALQNAFFQANQSDLPDLLLASPEGIRDLQAETEALFDLALLVEDPEWGLSEEEISDFLPGIWQTPAEDSQRLGLPVLRNARVLIYNRTWAGELGFAQAPGTPQEFQQQVCAAVQANLSAVYTLRGTGGWLLDNDAYTLLGWLQGFGAEFSDGFQFNTPEGLEAFSYLHELVDQDCTYRLPVASPEPFEPFAARRTLVYAGSLIDLPLQAQVSRKLENLDRWEILPFPALQGQGGVPLFGQDAAILDGTHEQELGSWLFLRWLLLSRNQAALAQIGGVLPVTRSGLQTLKTNGAPLAQYRQVLDLSDQFQPLPSAAGWGQARRVLEDATWQLYQPYTRQEDIPAILVQLDAMLKELEK